MELQLRRRTDHLVAVARDLGILLLILITTCCTAGGRFSEAAQAANAIATGEQASIQLASIPAPPGSDPAQFEELKQMLAAAISAQPRLASGAPVSEGSQVANLRAYNNGSGQAQISWTYCNQGDYDQNSEVSVQDLSSLGSNFGSTIQSPLWPISCVADGDGNGEVNSCDLTPIAQYLGTRCDSYLLQSSPDGAGSWQDVTAIPFADSSLYAAGGHRWFTIDTPAEIGTYWRVAPQSGGETGIASAPVVYSGEPAPVYSVSGSVSDPQATPIAGVQIELSGIALDTTDADGTYNFTGLDNATTALVSVSPDVRVFLPAQRAVAIDGADATDLDFTGYAVASLQHDLPAQMFSGEDFSFTIQAVDIASQPLAGFTTSAQLSSVPAGIQVLSALQFTDGIAAAHASFPDAGTYVVSLAGLGPAADGVLGVVEVAQPEIPELAVTTWRHDATAAISLTFDDGTADHWSRGMPLWEEFGFTVTLGIISSMYPAERIPQLSEALAAGHELANHSNTHPDFTTLTQAQVQQELQTCSDFLLSNVPELEYVPTVIYPYESFNDQVLQTLEDMGFLFARSGYQGIIDYAELNDTWDPPFLHLYSWANLNTLPVSMWDDTTDWAISNGGWLVEQCHGIGVEGETGVGWNPRPEAEYRQHYEHIASYGDQIWVAPIGDVGTYIIERNCAQFSGVAITGGRLEFKVETSLDMPAPVVPLTVRMSKPEGWDSVYVRQDGVPLTVDEYEIESVSYFRFDVVPDAGIVAITRM